MTTNKTVLAASQLAAAFYNRFNEYEKDGKTRISPDTPVQRKMKKPLRSFQEFADEYNDSVDTLRLKRCLKGEKGEILKNDKGDYIFTEAETLELKKDIKKYKSETCAIPIFKVDYEMFSADEKAYFDFEDEYIRELGEVFIENLGKAIVNRSISGSELVDVLKTFMEIMDCKAGKREIKNGGMEMYEMNKCRNTLIPEVEKLQKVEQDLRGAFNSVPEADRTQDLANKHIMELNELFKKEIKVDLHQFDLETAKTLSEYLSGNATLTLFNLLTDEEMV